MVKLYEKHSFMKEAVSVISVVCEESGEIWIELEESVFFPEEGGQYADTGTLTIDALPEGYEGNVKVGCTARVVDGQIRNGVIQYRIDRPLPIGARVSEKLDWELRFDRMQNHSGEHILTGCIHRRYGYNNVGFHLSDDGFVTLDMDGLLNYEQLLELEREANAIIYKDVPITDSYPADEELEAIDYRSKIEIEGQTRLITIADSENVYDVCACCAPHVMTTGQVGIVKVVSLINYKKGIQIAILCGRRALEYINKEHSILTGVSRFLSTSADNVETVVQSHVGEIADLKAKLARAVEGRLIDGIADLKEDEPRCLFTEEELTAANLKNVYNALCNGYDGYVGIFVGDDASGYRYNAGSAVKDSRDLANVMREKLGAKGGGSAEMIQGRVAADKLSILEVFGNV